MNVQSKIAKLTATERLNSRRVDELALASAALLGLVHVRGPVGFEHQAVVMGHINDLFGFSEAESQQASDVLFEGTLNHSITDFDRPRIEACALRLAEIAKHYNGTADHDRCIWAAGYDLFEVESLFEASQPSMRGERVDPVFVPGAASLAYFNRI